MADGSKMTISVKQGKRPAWTRAVDIILRAAHVAATGVLLGGAVFQVPPETLFKWQGSAVATGIALIISEIYHRPHWLYQGRAFMVIIHAGLFFLVRFRPYLAIPLLSGALVLGMAGSHMSRRFRHWSIIHWRAED